LDVHSAYVRSTPRIGVFAALDNASRRSSRMKNETKIIMAGHMTKPEALDWLVKYGAVVRGYPEDAAAAYPD
jgi:hypothetical protein